MSELTLPVEDADLARHGEAILAINNAAEPAVNALDRADLDALAAEGRVRVVLSATPEAPVAGLIVLMPPGAAYESPNYRWFSDRYDDFLYVDRIVVSPLARGSGIGRALYEDAIALALEGGRPRILSEVNVSPPNPESMAFHDRLGFAPIHERLNDENGKVVAMMVRELAPADRDERA
ncbi:GNAT family N-acetyltransferase [Acuticoccus sp. M5D2P5]|uniref:GNAT family N-acetyltransferase n=1 Tax=Acuticoccus kalidii TaxID=2910977 RepID=UPI001F31E2E0|nr:GNAT family N-acetyltransferase [Acuticoccus kalidii]MCF3936567.1 GNAT family N-acetyltransferase [Acuticoccus kalidii]